MGFSFEFPDDLIEQLEQISESDEMFCEALNNSAHILEKSVQRELKQHDLTGQMSKSVKCAKAKKGKNGNISITAEPKGYATYHSKSGKQYKTHNGYKAFLLQYGSSRETPKPWLEKAKSNCENEFVDSVQKELEKRLGIE